MDGNAAVSRTLRPVERETLERTARIIGPQSAAAQALADADRHDGPVNFYLDRGVVIVEKLAVGAPAAS